MRHFAITLSLMLAILAGCASEIPASPTPDSPITLPPPAPTPTFVTPAPEPSNADIAEIKNRLSKLEEKVLGTLTPSPTIKPPDYRLNHIRLLQIDGESNTLTFKLFHENSGGQTIHFDGDSHGTLPIGHREIVITGRHVDYSTSPPVGTDKIIYSKVPSWFDPQIPLGSEVISIPYSDLDLEGIDFTHQIYLAIREIIGQEWIYEGKIALLFSQIPDSIRIQQVDSKGEPILNFVDSPEEDALRFKAIHSYKGDLIFNDVNTKADWPLGYREISIRDVHGRIVYSAKSPSMIPLGNDIITIPHSDMELYRDDLWKPGEPQRGFSLKVKETFAEGFILESFEIGLHMKITKLS